MRIPYLIPVLTLALFFGSFFAGTVNPLGVKSARAQEHPEHPSGSEHPEHPSGSENPEHPASEEDSAAKEQPVMIRKPITIEAVAVYLEGYTAKKAAEHGGWMTIRDEEKDKTLRLKLDKIHRERLAKTDEGTYFVCADFITPNLNTYDLDFWVKETDEGLEVTETTIHKENGKARYTWVEKDGIWSRKPLDK